MRRELSPRTGAFLWVAGEVRAVEPLLAGTLDVFESFGEAPARLWVAAASMTNATFTKARLAKALASLDTTGVSVKGEGDAQVIVNLDLRFDRRQGTRPQAPRIVELVAPVVPPDDLRLTRFLEVACGSYAVLHGGVIHAATRLHAGAEANLAGGGGVDAEVDRRIQFDAMHTPEAQTKLRRLYPVTIIGPDLWATLPPLPTADPPLVVRDLADCKMVTAWPTLTDPHDLAFLLGTRDLRRWLWPYTIQNPADDPANTDNRLKWADLLPW